MVFFFITGSCFAGKYRDFGGFTMAQRQTHTVVIAGAGYAGLADARVLARDKNVRVILINKHAYHLLQFQLQEAAVNKIDIDSLALPMKYVLPRQVKFVKA